MIPLQLDQYGTPMAPSARVPSPMRPAAPEPVGTQDAPVLAGQKRGIVVAPVPTQPKPKRRLGWWEVDWLKTRRATLFQSVKQEVLAEDLPGARVPGPVSEAAYSDVIGVVRQRTIQGWQLKAEQTDREGSSELRRYVEAGQTDFPDVRLVGVLQIVAPVNDREAVPQGFAELGPVEAFTDVKTLYR